MGDNINWNYVWASYAVLYGVVMAVLGHKRAPWWVQLAAIAAGTWFFLEYAWC